MRKLEKQTVYSSCKDNYLGADLAYMQLTNRYNEGFHFLLCFIDSFSKYAWAAALKDKKRYCNNKIFLKKFSGSYYKPNKICEDKSSEFYNRSMNSWWQDYHI